jgi:hypothetical protein
MSAKMPMVLRGEMRAKAFPGRSRKTVRDMENMGNRRKVVELGVQLPAGKRQGGSGERSRHHGCRARRIGDIEGMRQWLRKSRGRRIAA